MAILGALLIGLVVGIVAKFLMPGRDPGGILITALIGMGGAVVASVLGRALNLYRGDEAPGFLAAVIGAIVILAIYRAVAPPASA